MPQIVVVSTATSGASVAVDLVGSTAAYQYAKLVGGAAGDTIPVIGTTAAPAAGAAGLVVRPVDGHSVTVANTVTISGTVTIIPTTFTVNTAATIAGASVTIQQGASVSAAVSGTVSISALTMWSASSAIGHTNVDAVPVALNQNALVSVRVIATAQVSVVAGASVGIVDVVPVTTAASVSVTGLPVWLNPTQGVNVSTVSGTVNINLAAAGTTIPVNIVAGGSQTTVISGTVAISIPVSQTVGTIIAVSGVTAVSVVSTIVTILGTQVVTMAQTSVSVAAVPTVNTIIAVSGVTAVSVVSTIGTVLGTQIVTLATGGSVAALDVGRTNVLIIVTSSSVGISGTTMPFTIYVGLSAGVAGTTSYVVPAGKTLRILAMNAVVQNSVTTSPANVRIAVMASTALPTWTSAVPVLAIVAVQAASATVGFSGAAVQVADIPAGATVGVAHTIGTSGASIVAAQAIGYLFP